MQRRDTPEEIVTKLRQVDVLIAQGTLGSIGVTAVAARRATGRRDLLLPSGGADHHRELATLRQQSAPGCLSGSRPPAPEVFVLAFVAWPARHPDRLRRQGSCY